MDEKTLVIIDNIGRYVIGKHAGETDTTLTLKSPVILHVAPNPQTNQLQVQTFPLFFSEFIDPSAKETNVWTYSKSSIVVSQVKLEQRILGQYENINNPQPVNTGGSPEVVKLFED